MATYYYGTATTTTSSDSFYVPDYSTASSAAYTCSPSTSGYITLDPAYYQQPAYCRQSIDLCSQYYTRYFAPSHQIVSEERERDPLRCATFFRFKDNYGRSIQIAVDDAALMSTGTDIIRQQALDAFNAPESETEEEKLARIKLDADYRIDTERILAEAKALEEEKKAAVAKAEELLKQHIGLQRYGVLYQTGYLEVGSQKYAGRKYRVSKNAMNRIEILEKDKVIDELCIVPTVTCPDGDRLLSKIVLLECDEEYVLKTANHFPRNN